MIDLPLCLLVSFPHWSPPLSRFLESTAAIQGKKRLVFQVCLFPTERAPEATAAEAVDVAAMVSERMVIDSWVVDTLVAVIDCVITSRRVNKFIVVGLDRVGMGGRW